MSDRTYGERILQVREFNHDLTVRLTKFTLFTLASAGCWIAIGALCIYLSFAKWLLPLVVLFSGALTAVLLFAWIMLGVHLTWTEILHRRFNTHRYVGKPPANDETE